MENSAPNQRLHPPPPRILKHKGHFLYRGTSYKGVLLIIRGTSYKGTSLPEIPSNPSDVPETQTSASNTPGKSQLQMNYLKTWFEKFNYLYLMFDIITNSNSLAKIRVTIRIRIMALFNSPSRKYLSLSYLWANAHQANSAPFLSNKDASTRLLL